MSGEPKNTRPPRQGGLGRAGQALKAAKSGEFVPLTPDPDRAQALQGAFSNIRQATTQAKADFALTDDELRSVLRALAVSTRSSEPPPAAPDKAPELWAQRDLNLRENAAQFIRRVYAPWLGKGLARKDLSRLDDDVYRALAVWLSRHPDDEIARLLPTQSDQLDRLVDRLSAEYPIEVLRKLGYAIDNRLRRQGR